MSTPEVDELIDAMQTGSAEESAAAAAELNRYVVENAWFAPIFRQTSVAVAGADTTIQMQPGNPYPYLWNIRQK
ncbi:MAG: hypothetical protein EOO67_04765 [Microbacterium sp.]|nr:MAG: hypothetical protein EOO67_04765 [Microbacterium sp.]